MKLMSLLTSKVTSKEFTPGTTGWTVDDLNAPEIEKLWEAGAYEIVEGVLTLLRPAYFDSSAALFSLIRILDRHVETHGPKGRFGGEADLIVATKRVARADAVFLTQDDLRRQEAQNVEQGKPMLRYGRLRIAPMLVIEAISVGHEDHDRQTKRGWYAELKVPNYWMLNAYDRTLECLHLVGNQYERDAFGRDDEELRPSSFVGLTIPLARLWT